MTTLVQAFREITASVSTGMEDYLKSVIPSFASINYQHGSYREIMSTLQNMNASPIHESMRYPLVALIEDAFSESNGQDPEYRFTVVICHDTMQDAKSGDRYREVIEPILLPIYHSLVVHIMKSGYFYGYEVPHKRIIRPFASKEGDAAVFSDVLDLIEMRDIRLKMYEEYCI